MEEINQPSAQPTPPPKRGMSKGVALLLFIVIMGAATAGAYWLKQNSPQNNDSEVPSSTPPPTPAPTPNNGTEPLVSGLVEWRYPTPTGLDLAREDMNQYAKYYVTGKFNSGSYKGKSIYLAIVPSCDGPCPSSALKLVESGNQEKPYIILKNHSTPLENIQEGFLKQTYTVDSTTRISDLSVPDSLTGPNPNQKLTPAAPGFFQAPYNLFNATNLKFVYNDPKVGSVYTSPDDPNKVDSIFNTNGFYVKAPDWNTLIYTYTPPFQAKDNIPQVTWNVGGANKSEYLYNTIGGCGMTDYVAVAHDVKQTDLQATGKTAQGDSVYEFKDSNHSYLKDAYENEYNPYSVTKLNYDEYVKLHPMFFWTDPFGRLIRFRKSEFFRSEAECAKPAIYLYPKKTTNVSVKVDPVGGFTYTDPEYGTGWNVTAKPDGTIIVSGKEYPYLFWEGRGGLYQTPVKGFVVARADVHNFLVEKLARLGLNQKETSDFTEYWEPFMKDSPYYFVTFMGNQAMDMIAPLQVRPTPDTVIRVLMDFKPLEKPIEVQGFEIKTPVRKGFTVVEWGGVKH